MIMIIKKTKPRLSNILSKLSFNKLTAITGSTADHNRHNAKRYASSGLLGVSLLTLSSLTIPSTFMVLSTTALTMTLPHHAAADIGMADFSDLVTQVTPSVARVNVVKEISEAEILHQLYDDNLPLPNRARLPALEHTFGTAFFVTEDGYLLTNYHVIADADDITVTLNDRTVLDATLVGGDERSDMAVLKVDSPTGDSFPALPMGDSSLVKVGEPVLAIGSPFGFDYSASAGIVSAKSRNFSREVTVPFIQTDVALNPGNSGGPLFNQHGEVIGINSRIFSSTGSYIGLSFSIPINTAMDIYEQIKHTGTVRRAYLGVIPQDMDRTLAEAFGLSRPQGALLSKVTPESPADLAGLKTGDIILRFNNKQIVQASDLINEIERTQAQQPFSATILRNGQTLNVEGLMAIAPTDMTSDLVDEANDKIQLGLRLRNISEVEQSVLGSTGVLITAVDPTGLAARSGLQAGDIITHLHQLSVENVDDFATAITTLPTQGVVTISIVRQGVPAIIGLRIE